MQILLVTPGYPPMHGGIETHLGALAQGLSRRGAEVEVWTHGQAAPAGSVGSVGSVDSVGSVEDDGLLVRRFATTRSHRFPVSPGLFWQARSALRARPGLLHVHGYHATPALTALQAPASMPVVFTPHFHGVGHTRLAALLHGPYRPIGARVFRRADRVIAVSAAEAALLAEREPECAVRTTVIRNGTDVSGIQAATGFADQPPTILVAGRHEGYKHIDAVIRAFGAGSGPGQLVVTGDGPDTGRLREVAAAGPRAGQIRFLGHVPLAELRRWQRTAVALVSMSAHEAFGLVAIEAVAGGAHAILSDIPAHREIGGWVPAGSVTLVDGPDRLAAAIQLALESAKPAPRSVRSWDDVVTEHLALYENVLSAQR